MNEQPSSARSRFIVFSSCILIVLNAAIFIAANNIPIYWVSPEFPSYGFFWSMNGVKDYHLHTGFQAGDWIKPLFSYEVDGVLRMRQVSYFFEMLSFKFWQLFEKVLFRDYTVIGLHVLNVSLLGALTFLITRQKRTAIAVAILFLNSGVSLATLLFPFRNAKILVVTFTLLAWILIAASPGKFYEASFKKRILFFLLLLLAFFTDETALFLFLLVFVYLGLRDGWQGVWNPKVRKGIIFSAGIYAALCIVVWKTIVTLNPQDVIKNLIHRQYFWNYAQYFTSSNFFYDVTTSFFFYFLPKNFGYWDFTVFGALAAGAFIGLWIIIFRQGTAASFILWFCLAIVLVVFLKLILLPHSSGIHKVFMPPKTTFPSLHFFSYYYVYCDSLWMSLMVGLALGKSLQSNTRYILVLILISLISFSNLIHLKAGPLDALKFHDFSKPELQRIVQKIEDLGRVIKQRKDQYPVYVAVPGVNSKIVIDALHHPRSNYYVRVIPLRYLRSAEEGRVILPFENTGPQAPFSSKFELTNANYFYDVQSKEGVDLRALRTRNPRVSLRPRRFAKSARTILSGFGISQKDNEIVIFIRGEAQFLLSYGTLVYKADQDYGQSFQMFKFKLSQKTKIPRGHLELTVIPMNKKNPQIEIVGPFSF